MKRSLCPHCRKRLDAERPSQLTRSECAELIEFVMVWAANELGVVFYDLENE